MSDFPLLEYAEKAPVADTSLSAFQRILPTLAEREYLVFEGVWSFCLRSGFSDCTGAELAEWMHLDRTQIRPRVTGLLKKGLLESLPARQSRASIEGRCHPVRCAVPLAAIARAERKRKAA